MSPPATDAGIGRADSWPAAQRTIRSGRVAVGHAAAGAGTLRMVGGEPLRPYVNLLWMDDDRLSAALALVSAGNPPPDAIQL